MKNEYKGAKEFVSVEEELRIKREYQRIYAY